MKILKDPSSKLWTLTSGKYLLYSGSRSPWENPRLMRAALERERNVAASARAPRSDAPGQS